MAVFNSNDIKNMVEKMNESKIRHQDLKENNKEEYVKRVAEDCPILFKEYDSIFKMNIEDRLDDTFIFMLSQLRKREIGKISKTGVEKNIIGHLGKKSRENPQPPVGSMSESEPHMNYMDFINGEP
jgi:hypothetical protein